LLYTRLYAGTEAKCDQRTQAVPPSVVQAFRASGMQNVTALRRGADIWTYAECEPDARTALERLAMDPANRDLEP
jgi:hypothetical protein